MIGYVPREKVKLICRITFIGVPYSSFFLLKLILLGSTHKTEIRLNCYISK